MYTRTVHYNCPFCLECIPPHLQSPSHLSSFSLQIVKALDYLKTQHKIIHRGMTIPLHLHV